MVKICRTPPIKNRGYANGSVKRDTTWRCARLVNATWRLYCSSVIGCDLQAPRQKFTVSVAVNFVAVQPHSIQLPTR